MSKAKVFRVLRHFEGEPKESDFELVEEDLPELQNGEFRAEALCWSIDPYMRVYVKSQGLQLPNVMIGRQISRVISTKNAEYKVGDLVFGNFGWRTHTNVSLDKYTEVEKLPDYGGLPYSLGLGMLGRPGHSAYFGLLELCEPKKGQTVVISGAAGAVGSHVGQIAKILGCTVIGFAGSDKKVEWLLSDLGFDHAFNYKTTDIAAVLKQAAPQGVHCYFDNVGGSLSSVVLAQMCPRGRIAVCGSISGYNALEVPTAPYVQRSMVSNQLRMEGFLVGQWKDRFQESVDRNIQWLKEGKLKFRETITEGFDNLPTTFIGMLRGENIGKTIVKSGK